MSYPTKSCSCQYSRVTKARSQQNAEPELLTRASRYTQQTVVSLRLDVVFLLLLLWHLYDWYSGIGKLMGVNCRCRLHSGCGLRWTSLEYLYSFVCRFVGVCRFMTAIRVIKSWPQKFALFFAEDQCRLRIVAVILMRLENSPVVLLTAAGSQ